MTPFLNGDDVNTFACLFKRKKRLPSFVEAEQTYMYNLLLLTNATLPWNSPIHGDKHTMQTSSSIKFLHAL